MKKFLSVLLCMALIFSFAGCTQDDTIDTTAEPTAAETDVPEEEETEKKEAVVGTYDKFDLDTYMTPVWEGNVVYNETVMFIDVGDKVNLMYPAEEIISVRSYDLNTEYKKGVDYDYVDGQLVLLEGTSINYIGTEKYYSAGDAPHLRCDRDGTTSTLYFSEEIFEYQVCVTYTHNSDWGDKFIATTESEQFAKLIQKLKNGEDVTMFYYGDSITYGASASDVRDSDPHMPSWAEMLTMYIAEQYGYTVKYVNTGLEKVWLGQTEDTVFGTNGTITYINSAVGGLSCETGLANYDEYVKPFLEKYGCDFFLLGFGMNDGGTLADQEKLDVKKIADLVYGQVPEVEMAILATMVPNPDVTNGWYGQQETFEPVLYTLAEDYQKDGKHCAVVPMTSMSLSVLTVKNFRDYTGNNVNHPNDFFARIYAQTIFQTVIGYDTVKK